MFFFVKKIKIKGKYFLKENNNGLIFFSIFNKFKRHYYFPLPKDVLLFKSSGYLYFLGNIEKKKYILTLAARIEQKWSSILRVFTLNLVVKGFGYFMKIKKNYLFFSLGYSHIQVVKLPCGVTAGLWETNKFFIRGYDVDLILKVLFLLKKLRPIRIYSEKGIFLESEKFSVRKIKAEGK